MVRTPPKRCMRFLACWRKPPWKNSNRQKTTNTGHFPSMEIKRGIAVSPGVAIGPALVVDTEGFRIPQRLIEKKQRKEEVARLREALKAAALEARANPEAINA